MKKPTVATLFAGGGGDSLGFTSAGFDLVFANDNNPDACETLRSRFENGSGKKIVHKGNVEKIENFTNANVITGGFPCQGFSLAGPREVKDKRNSLYQELRELYERNHKRIQNLMCSNKAKGFERFAWYLMLSDETQKRFR